MGSINLPEGILRMKCGPPVPLVVRQRLFLTPTIRKKKFVPSWILPWDLLKASSYFGLSGGQSNSNQIGWNCLFIRKDTSILVIMPSFSMIGQKLNGKRLKIRKIRDLSEGRAVPPEWLIGSGFGVFLGNGVFPYRKYLATQHGCDFAMIIEGSQVQRGIAIIVCNIQQLRTFFQQPFHCTRTN